MHWWGVWPCRDSSAAACNMWPHRLPGSLLSIFHYSLFSCWTAVQHLPHAKKIYIHLFFHGVDSIYSITGNWILCGWKIWQLKPTPESLDWYSIQVKFVAAFQTIICGIEFPQIRSSKTNGNSTPIIMTFQSDESMTRKVFYVNQYVCQFEYILPVGFWTENSNSLKLGMHIFRTWMESSKCASKAWTWGTTSQPYVDLVTIHGQLCKTQLSGRFFHQFLWSSDAGLFFRVLGRNSAWQKENWIVQWAE